MAEMDISIIANVSIAESPRTLGFYSPNTLLILTNETPVSTFTGSYAPYWNAQAAATDWGTNSSAYKLVQAALSQSPSILSASTGVVYIAPMRSGESVSDAMLRLSEDVYFAGVLCAQLVVGEDADEAAVTAQTLDTVWFFPSNNADQLNETTGKFWAVSQAGQTHTKPLLYTASEDAALYFSAAYASRALAVEFTGQNTTNTLNLKDMIGLLADDGITNTIYTQCQELGVDIYPSVGGLPKVISNAVAGQFFDQIYNRMWFKKRVQVEVFNGLAGTRTKIPQTEVGMNFLKGKVQEVCALAVYNGMFAPGKWNSSDTFGNPDDFRRNILESGYFIYSAPVSQQAQADRETRKAPLISVAGKEAGAIHSANIIIYFEA